MNLRDQPAHFGSQGAALGILLVDILQAQAAERLFLLVGNERLADSRVAIERASQENRTERLQSFLAAVLALTVVSKQADALGMLLPLIIGVLCGAAMMAAAERIRRT